MNKSDRTPPLNALKVFEAAARHLSFKKAAAELRVTPAAVSHQLSQLEELLGVRLFERFNQGIQLTPAARASLSKLQEGFECLRESIELIGAHSLHATISVAASPSFATLWLLPRLHRFVLAHPEIDVRVATRMEPFINERSARISPESVRTWVAETDVVLMFNSGAYPELHVEELMRLSITPICSPAWFSSHDLSPGRWNGADILHDDRGALYTNHSFWALWLKAAGYEHIDTGAGTHFTHAIMALSAAEEGLGIVASTPALVRQQIGTGCLVCPFPLEVPLSAGYHLLSSKVAARRDDVILFRNWLHAEVARSDKFATA